MRSEQGNTLVEVLVALSLFSVVAVGTTSSFIGNMQHNNVTDRKTGAFEAAQQVLDNLRQKDPTSLPTNNTAQTQNITIGDHTYNMRSIFCPSGTTYCTSNNVRHVRVRASLNGTKEYEVDTVFAQLR